MLVNLRCKIIPCDLHGSVDKFSENKKSWIFGFQTLAATHEETICSFVCLLFSGLTTACEVADSCKIVYDCERKLKTESRTLQLQYMQERP